MYKEVYDVVIAYQKLQDDPDFLFLLDLYRENPLMDDLLDKLSHLEDVLARPKATNTRPMLHPGFTARSNNGAGPATSKPDIVAKPQPPRGRVVDVHGSTVPGQYPLQ